MCAISGKINPEILHQSYKKYEFIIVDDKSTDGSNELIRQLHHPRIRFFPCEHRGRGGALNYAVAQAQGDVLALMDADDVALTHRLEKQYSFLQQHTAISIVSSWYKLIDREGTPLRVIRKLPESYVQIEYEMTIHCSACFPLLR